MRQSRAYRYLATLVALVGVLFAQMAIATYVCPDFLSKPSPDTMQMAPHQDRAMGGKGCTEIDNRNPNLCIQYAQSGDQSLDRPLIAFLAPLLVFLYFVLLRAQPVTRLVTFQNLDRRLHKYKIKPSLAIQHCCFRI